jgi:hypothetical protein
VCARNHDATVELTGGRRGAYASTSGPPANYPVSSLFGSPFTTLAVTQNYLSHLHCEPEEHPFSFITWLDVLGAGSSMKVSAHTHASNGLRCWPIYQIFQHLVDMKEMENRANQSRSLLQAARSEHGIARCALKRRQAPNRQSARAGRSLANNKFTELVGCVDLL